MTYTCLLLGLGNIGLQYDLNLDRNFILTHAKAASLHPDFDLVGAIDPDPIRCQIFSNQYSKPSFQSLDEAKDEVVPEVIIIATPSGSHEKTLVEVLEFFKPKAILCEKPMNYNLSSAKRMLEICERSNVKLFVNYMRRSDPGSLKVAKLIENDLIQAPLKGIVWYSKGLFNNGSHFLNLLDLWLGPCTGIQVLSEGKSYNCFDKDYDFYAKFNESTIYFCASLECTTTYNSIELVSQNGRLEYKNGGSEIMWYGLSHNEILNRSEIVKKPRVIQKNLNKYQFNVFNELGNALDGRNFSLSMGSDAIETLRTITKVTNGALHE